MIIVVIDVSYGKVGIMKLATSLMCYCRPIVLFDIGDTKIQ